MSTDVRSRPPSPDGVPILGHGLAFTRDPFGSMSEWAAEGSVVRLEFTGQTMYMVTVPELVQRILVKEQHSYVLGSPQRETFEGIEDDAVTANTGERWRRLRKGMQPAFTWESIREYGGRMSQSVVESVDDWNDGQQFELLREMRLVTLRALADTLLGTDIKGDEEVVLNAADALVDRSNIRRPGQLLPNWVPTPTERRFERAVAELDEYIADILDDRSPGHEDVCSELLAAHERGELSEAEVHDNLTALMLAGHDSPAVVLTYAWLELSRNPDIREELVAEAEQVVDGELPDYDDFDDLRRTRDVLRETMRLYPPAWTVMREAVKPVTLDGYELPEGALLLLPQWVLHRDERFWEKPETFDPDRWERDRDRPEYAYFPFSGGPRHCIGMRFARLELTMTLATMAERVVLDISVEEPLTFTPSLSLRPENDVTATVRRI